MGFLSARNGNVPEAMTMIQGHGRWRNEFFPIDLKEPSLQKLLQLSNHDTGLTNEMFLPGYASVGGILDGPTLARENNVRLGDIIVAVSGEGFRRFPPDFPEATSEDVATDATEERVPVVYIDLSKL